MRLQLEQRVQTQRCKDEARRWLRHNNADAIAAHVMFHLNRLAVDGHRTQRYTYALKDRFIEHLYRSGFCTEVLLYEQTQKCWACNNPDWYDDEFGDPELCWRCGGTGIYSRHYLYCFVFDIHGRHYVWCQPQGRIRFNVDVTGDVQDWGTTARAKSDSQFWSDGKLVELYCVTLREYLVKCGFTDLPMPPKLSAGTWRNAKRWLEGHEWWWAVLELRVALKRWLQTGDWFVEDRIPF